MRKNLNQKVILISAIALMVSVLLAAGSIVVLLDARQHANLQIHDAQQATLNADFDLALVRAAGESASFAITKRQGYGVEARQALDRARSSIDMLQKTLGGTPLTEGLEAKHQGLITRQRELLAMVERGYDAAQKLGPVTDPVRVNQVLDAIYAYEGPAELVRADVVVHRESEATTNARYLRDNSQKLIYAFVANIVVILCFAGFALAVTRGAD